MNTQAISSNASVFNKVKSTLSKIRGAKNKELNETNTLHTRNSIVNPRLPRGD
jgi:hypothetical protein